MINFYESQHAPLDFNVGELSRRTQSIMVCFNIAWLLWGNKGVKVGLTAVGAPAGGAVS